MKTPRTSLEWNYSLFLSDFVHFRKEVHRPYIQIGTLCKRVEAKQQGSRTCGPPRAFMRPALLYSFKKYRKFMEIKGFFYLQPAEHLFLFTTLEWIWDPFHKASLKRQHLSFPVTQFLDMWWGKIFLVLRNRAIFDLSWSFFESTSSTTWRILFQMVHCVWAFYMSKFTEFIDTVMLRYVLIRLSN